jgi:hypothetical protein
MNPETGKWLIGLGVLIVILGAIIYFFHDLLHWIGRLPGDVRLTRGNFRFYFPLATLILVSLLLNIILRIFRKS